MGQASRASSPENRGVTRYYLTANANALRWPTRTTKRLPRVIAV